MHRREFEINDQREENMKRDSLYFRRHLTLLTSFKVEKDLQQTIRSHDLDQDERIRQIQAQMQEERVESRREMQEKISEIEKLMYQITSLETEVDRLRNELASLKSRCDEFEHDRQGYEDEIRLLREGGIVEEERATTTLVLNTQARPEEKHVTSTSK